MLHQQVSMAISPAPQTIGWQLAVCKIVKRASQFIVLSNEINYAFWTGPLASEEKNDTLRFLPIQKPFWKLFQCCSSQCWQQSARHEKVRSLTNWKLLASGVLFERSLAQGMSQWHSHPWWSEFQHLSWLRCLGHTDEWEWWAAQGGTWGDTIWSCLEGLPSGHLLMGGWAEEKKEI